MTIKLLFPIEFKALFFKEFNIVAPGNNIANWVVNPILASGFFVAYKDCLCGVWVQLQAQLIQLENIG
jgi:hypothetical protein